jgi:hypothetical protein
VQEAQDTAGTQSESRSWLGTAALAVVAIAGIVAGVIIFTSDRGAPDAPPTRPNNNAPALTDQGAIDRYLKLEELVVRAYRNADFSLLSLIYTSNSPTAKVVREEFTNLRQDSARLLLTYQTEAIEVVSQSPDEFVLRQEVIIRGRLKAVGGAKVSARYHDQRQVVRAILRYEEPNGWLIHNVVAIDSERLQE